MENIAVLMTCHNRKEITIQCLDALFFIIQNTGNKIKFDVYIVDDGSTDGTSQAIKEKYQTPVLILGNGHLFWNRGMNLAWSVAAKKDYDYYLWLNDDTILKNNSIELLLKHAKQFDNNAIICGVCESSKTGEITYGGYEIYTHKLIIPNGYPQWCFFFNGNIALISRKIYNIIGNLDSVFHHSLGDWDYGLKGLKKGINTYVTSESIGYCERNDLPQWCNPGFSFSKRLKIFYSPLGAVPFQHFIFVKRHYGYGKAFRNLFSNHLRLVFPSIWIKNKD